jgi:protease-4
VRRRAAVGLGILGIGLVVLLAFLWVVFRGERLAGDRVALVAVEGLIADSRFVVEQLERYRTQPNVKALVVRIDSPGGGVAPSQEIYSGIVRFRERSGKPVVASMGRVAASGGYYVAAAANRIVANPGTITGSIGVIMQLPNVSGLLQKVGISTTVIKSGEFKDLGGAVRDLTPAERKVLQDLLDDVHGQFIDAVAAGRRMDRTKVVSLADGRVFSGRFARELGLVDELGDLRDAIARAAVLAGLPETPPVIQERRRSLWDMIWGAGAGVERALGFAVPATSPTVDYLWSVR